jgi:hypothetical protein
MFTMMDGRAPFPEPMSLMLMNDQFDRPRRLRGQP